MQKMNYLARANLIKVNTDLKISSYELLALLGEMNAKSLDLPVQNFYDNTDHYNNLKNF